MNWVVIAIIVLAVIIAVLIIIKMRLRKRLDNIDGLHGVHTEDLNQNEGTVIGSFGNDEQKNE